MESVLLLQLIYCQYEFLRCLFCLSHTSKIPKSFSRSIKIIGKEYRYTPYTLVFDSYVSYPGRWRLVRGEREYYMTWKMKGENCNPAPDLCRGAQESTKSLWSSGHPQKLWGKLESIIGATYYSIAFRGVRLCLVLREMYCFSYVSCLYGLWMSHLVSLFTAAVSSFYPNTTFRFRASFPGTAPEGKASPKTKTSSLIALHSCRGRVDMGRFQTDTTQNS